MIEDSYELFGLFFGAEVERRVDGASGISWFRHSESPGGVHDDVTAKLTSGEGAPRFLMTNAEPDRFVTQGTERVRKNTKKIGLYEFLCALARNGGGRERQLAQNFRPSRTRAPLRGYRVSSGEEGSVDKGTVKSDCLI